MSTKRVRATRKKRETPVSVSIRLTGDEHKTITDAAKEQKRSFNSFVIVAALDSAAKVIGDKGTEKKGG